MENATFLHLVATNHAMSHAKRQEPWLCDCIACRFSKEYKVTVQNDDGTFEDVTFADVLLRQLAEQGFHTYILEPVSE